MSQPDPLGAVGQLLMGSRINPAEKLGWHTFGVRNPKGGEAGRWCKEMITGQWTFTAEYGEVTFFIKEDKDAMLFKLAWHDFLKDKK